MSEKGIFIKKYRDTDKYLSNGCKVIHFSVYLLCSKNAEKGIGCYEKGECIIEFPGKSGKIYSDSAKI